MGTPGRTCITRSQLRGCGKVTNAASRNRYSGKMEATRTTTTKFLGVGGAKGQRPPETILEAQLKSRRFELGPNQELSTCCMLPQQTHQPVT